MQTDFFNGFEAFPIYRLYANGINMAAKYLRKNRKID